MQEAPLISPNPAVRIASMQGRIAVLQLDLQAAKRSRDHLSDQALIHRGLAAEQGSPRNKMAYDLAALQLRMQADSMARQVGSYEAQIAIVEAMLSSELSDVHHSGPAQLARIQAGQQQVVLSAAEVAGMDDMLAYSARAA